MWQRSNCECIREVVFSVLKCSKYPATRIYEVIVTHHNSATSGEVVHLRQFFLHVAREKVSGNVKTASTYYYSLIHLDLQGSVKCVHDPVSLQTRTGYGETQLSKSKTAVGKSESKFSEQSIRMKQYHIQIPKGLISKRAMEQVSIQFKWRKFSC